MITFKNTNGLKVPLSVQMALWNIEATFRWLKSDIDHLPIVTFDPLYTKPANLTSVDIISEALFEYDLAVTIKLYTQNWFSYKYAPVNAHVKNNEPDTIYLNTRMFKWTKKTEQDWRETILHELTHIMDAHSIKTFWHGDDNSLRGKDNSAPVKLARILSTLDFTNVGLAYEH